MKPVERINTQHKPQRMSAPAKNRVNGTIVMTTHIFRYVPRHSVCSTYLQIHCREVNRTTGATLHSHFPCNWLALWSTVVTICTTWCNNNSAFTYRVYIFVFRTSLRRVGDYFPKQH
jgi:hypothetical protein